MKKIITAFTFFFVTFNLLQGQVTITNTTNYLTQDQLLLANELNESGEPFAEALGYNLDDLDPMTLNSPDSIAYTLGIENYEYSRYQLGTVISRSGIGLHMMWGPAIMNMAAMITDSTFDGSFTGGTANGYKEDDVLMMNIMGFGARAHMTPFAHPWPQFAEFTKGDPHLPQAVQAGFETDFASLRWDRAKMEKVLNLGAMGQSLMKQYLWAQDMLSAFHDANEGEVAVADGNPDDANGQFDASKNIFFGGDNADGFIGQVLTAEAINKTLFIINKLAYDGASLGAISPATYDPTQGIKYFPHGIDVEEGMVIAGLPPRMTSLTVSDPKSVLFDQISYLWGALNFKNMMDPANTSDDAHLAYKYAFDGDPFPAAASVTGMAGPFDLMKGTSKVIFQNMMAMHFNDSMGSFVSESNLSNGVVVKGNKISAVDAGYMLMVLSKMVEEFAGTPIESMATNAINMQANFILNSFKDPTGGYYNGVELGVGPMTTPKLAVNQAAIARGLYAAYALTNNAAYLTGANEAYARLMSFYRPSVMTFQTEENNAIATYTPWNVAIITGALREAAVVGNKTEAPTVYTRFFKKIINKMQLAEFGPTGETGSDSDGDGVPYLMDQPDNLPPIFAPEGTYDLGVVATVNIEDHLQALTSFPNPVREQVTISFNLKHSAQVKLDIYDLNGQRVSSKSQLFLPKGQQQIEVDVTQYPANTFFYNLTIDNKTSIAGQFTKQ